MVFLFLSLCLVSSLRETTLLAPLVVSAHRHSLERLCTAYERMGAGHCAQGPVLDGEPSGAL